MNGPDDGRVVQLLAVVDLVPPGHAAGVVVADVALVLPDGLDHVPLHDLHVVDVVEEFEVVRADHLGQRRAPLGVVAHVIRVVALTVQQFHLQRHAGFLGEFDHGPQADGAVPHAVQVRQAPAVTAHHDHVPDAVVGGVPDRLGVVLPQRVPVLRFVPAVFDREGVQRAHRARHAVLLQGRPLVHRRQFDGLQPDVLAALAEFLQRDVPVAPLAGTVLRFVVLTHQRVGGLGGSDGPAQGDGPQSQGGLLQRFSAVHGRKVLAVKIRDFRGGDAGGGAAAGASVMEEERGGEDGSIEAKN